MILKQKLLTLAVAIMMIAVPTFVMVTPTSSSVTISDDPTSKGLEYKYNPDGTATVIGWNEKDNLLANGNVKIPEMVEYEAAEYTVTAIDNSAFYQCSGLETISIPKTVLSIGDQAFYNCSNYDYYTYKYNGLKTVTFEPESNLKTIGLGAFGSCQALTSITIPASVENIGTEAFNSCSLSDVTFENNSNLKEISEWAFGGNSYLESISIPGSVKTIGGCAFALTGLTSITIPSSVTSLAGGFVHKNGGLMDVSFDSGQYYHKGSDGNIYNTGESTLVQSCYNSSNKLPDTVTKIGPSACCYLSDGSEITEHITEIDRCAFWFCSGLQSITIPSSVTTIGELAFCGCYSVETVTFNTGSQLKTIGDWAFRNCQKLESITIPASVQSIGKGAFYGCEYIMTVKFDTGSQLKTIGEGAFGYCKMESIKIPASVEEMGASVFLRCEVLVNITVENGNTHYVAENNVLYNYNKTVILRCGNNQNSVSIPNTVTTIGTGAFSGCNSIKQVTFETGSQLKTIENGAFVYAFYGTVDEPIVLPDTVEKIDESGFYGAHFKKITIPKSVTEIGNEAFSRCNSLRTITFENGSELKTIGDSAFYYTDLSNISIPNGVISIGKNAFVGSSSLATITIPKSVESIGIDSFAYCSSLTTIDIDKDNEHYADVDGVLYSKDFKTLLCVPAKNTMKDVAIPETVTKICSNSLTGNIKSLSIPESVYCIERNFINCYFYDKDGVVIDDYSKIVGKKFFYNSSNYGMKEWSLVVTTPSTVTDPEVNIEGTTNGTTLLMSLNGGTAETVTLNEGAFSVPVTLNPGKNTVELYLADDSACSETIEITCSDPTTKHTVTFEVEGQTPVIQEVEDGKTATRIADPVVTGYEFVGWFLNGKLYDFTTPVTADITLKAKLSVVEEKTAIIDARSVDKVEISYHEGVDTVIVIFMDATTEFSTEPLKDSGDKVIVSIDRKGMSDKYDAEAIWQRSGQPYNGEITIILPYDKERGTPTVYYYPETGEPELMDATIDEDAQTVTFTTDHNSVYGIEYSAEPVPSTSGDFNLAILIVFVAAMLGVVYVGIVARRD